MGRLPINQSTHTTPHHNQFIVTHRKKYEHNIRLNRIICVSKTEKKRIKKIKTNTQKY